MIEVKNLCKNYGKKKALSNLTFSVKKGEILGFLGPNGAGKSTTMNILTGYISTTGGSVEIDGFDILNNPIEAKKKMGYLPEHPPLYLDMTVAKYLSFMFDLKKVSLKKEEKKQAHIKNICSLLKLDDVYKRIIKNLSKGYKQRVGLAQALLGHPEVLILDEPTVGLDPKQIIEIRNLIKGFGENHTVILSSHILSEVQAICDRVIVLNKGILVADDTAFNLSNVEACVKYTAKIQGDEAEVLEKCKQLDSVKDIFSLGEKEKGVYDFIVEGEVGESKDIRKSIFDLAVENNWILLGIHTNEMSLEEAFLNLTKDIKESDITKKDFSQVLSDQETPNAEELEQVQKKDLIINSIEEEKDVSDI